jgi:hypothetical protein
MPDGMVGRRYLEHGQPVTVLARWQGNHCPRNVLVERADGSRVVRPFRGLRRGRCGCGAHELHPVASVGKWLHNSAVVCDILTVAEVAAEDEFWERCDLARDDLETQIGAVGGVDCDHALEAARAASGEVLMLDGCHRWAIADALGLRLVPVLMTTEE